MTSSVDRFFGGQNVAIMGIVNVTPDSFSDGGQFASTSEAIEQGLTLIEEGADIIDIGGESTRPGSEGVDVGTELSRVMPVIDGLKSEFAGFSTDRDLVKLRISGRISADLYDGRYDLLEILQQHVLYLEDDLSGLKKELRAADIEKTFTDGSFPFRLLTGLLGDDGDPEALLVLAHPVVATNQHQDAENGNQGPVTRAAS